MYKFEEVEDFITSNFEDATHISKIGRGAWSDAYAFAQEGNEKVIRFSKTSEDFEKDNFAHSFKSRSLPIPKVEKIGEAFDGYFCISERSEGEFLEEHDLSVTDLRNAIFTMLDAIRQIQISPENGFGIWDGKGIGRSETWRDHLLRVNVDDDSMKINGWKKVLERDEERNAIFSSYVELLKELSRDIEIDAFVVHSDLTNKNVLVKDYDITSVFDWGNSIYGDFLYDIAWFQFWAPWHHEQETIDWKKDFKEHAKEINLEIPKFDDRFNICLVHIGLVHLAYNVFKDREVELFDQIANRMKQTVN